MVLKGDYSKRLPLPLVPLSDGAGEVAGVGPGVTRFKPGDRVAGCFMPAWSDGPPDDAAVKSGDGRGGRRDAGRAGRPARDGRRPDPPTT